MAKRDPVSEYLSMIGQRGGQARVPKGTAKLTKEERSQRAKEAAEARWGKKRSGRAKKPKKVGK